jgi:hypothetical protein
MAPKSSYPLPHDAPVFLTRVGREQRWVVVAVLDNGPFTDKRAADKACESWRIKVGRWISKAAAAHKLGVSVKRIDALRDSGQLRGFTVGNTAAIDYDSVVDECNRRSESSDPRLNPLPE